MRENVYSSALLTFLVQSCERSLYCAFAASISLERVSTPPTASATRTGFSLDAWSEVPRPVQHRSQLSALEQVQRPSQRIGDRRSV